MKYNKLPDMHGMSMDEIKVICLEKGIEAEFHDLSNGRYDYPVKRAVRYKIIKKDSREVLVCDITGFPTLNYEQKQQN